MSQIGVSPYGLGGSGIPGSTNVPPSLFGQIGGELLGLFKGYTEVKLASKAASFDLKARDAWTNPPSVYANQDVLAQYQQARAQQSSSTLFTMLIGGALVLALVLKD